MNEMLKMRFLALSDSEKIVFLAQLSHDLTIHGRSFGLDLAPETQIAAFKGLNELQHQISSHISGLGLGRDRYPDDVLWKILHETASNHRLSAHLRSSLDRLGAGRGWEISASP
jgi:hypothetical protein